MTREKQSEIYNEIDKKLLEVSQSKGHDYANENVLSNFIEVSAAARALRLDVGKPEQYALFMVLLKISRLSNLLNAGKTPNNESIQDSFLDGINYFKLAYCCHVDSQ